MMPAPLRQRWEHLLFLHWRTDAERLAGLLPPGLTLDTFDGRAYIGIVPFSVPMNRMRIVPAPLSLPFHEINLRTYVKGPGGVSGVWFFSLDASSRLAVIGARALYHLPYRYREIDFGVEEEGSPGKRRWIHFTSQPPGSSAPECRVRYSPADVPRAAAGGSLEHFLIERYVLYARTGARLLSARVHHEPYPVQEAELDGLQQQLTDSAGVPPLGGDPLVHYARGLTVDISLPFPPAPHSPGA